MLQAPLIFDRPPIFFGCRKPTIPVHKLRINEPFDPRALLTTLALPSIQCYDEEVQAGFIFELRMLADHKDLDLDMRSQLKDQHSVLWSPQALESVDILIGEALYIDLQPHGSNIYAVFLRGSTNRVEDYIVLSYDELHEIKMKRILRQTA